MSSGDYQEPIHAASEAAVVTLKAGAKPLTKPPKPARPPRSRRQEQGRPGRSITDAGQLEPVPPELKALPQWVLWKWERRLKDDGTVEWTKAPFQTTHGNADSTDPATWTDFDTAFGTYLSGPDFDGIGYVFTADDPYTGVDLDKCLGADGSMKSWAVNVYNLLTGGYAEISPSGTGVKIWVRGKLPAEAKHKKTGFGEDGSGVVEMYDAKRFFTVTGRVFTLAIKGGKS